MKHFHKAAILGLVFTAFDVLAQSTIANATISNLNIDRSNKQVLIRTSVSPLDQANRVECHTGNGWNYVMDLSTEKDAIDDYILSAILAAYTSQKPMNLAGNGTCPQAGQRNVEILKSITPLQ